MNPPKSFGEASRMCQNAESSLVEIENVQENHFVSSIVAGNKRIWIGEQTYSYLGHI